jgi:hypothetical protein
MRKVLITVALLLIPSAMFAQGLRPNSPFGKVEVRSASSRNFVPLTNQVVQPGDEIRTGSGGQVVLEAPDGSYLVINENSKVIVDDFWSGSFQSIVNVMLGQVRFYVQKFGGRPNSKAVRTPTALIAVRGTTFDVIVDDAQFTEVWCREGRVTVEAFGTDREVILEEGFKTLVRPGEAPVIPIRLEAELQKNRTINLKRKNSAPESIADGVPAMDILRGDNDRRNRTLDPQRPNSGTNSNTQRAKPTLTFP